MVAANQAGSLTLTSGQSAVAEAGKAPVLRVVARPRDAVQWALYYPPVLYVRPDEFPAGPDWQGMVRQSIEFYLRGDLQKAFDSLQNVPEDYPRPALFLPIVPHCCWPWAAWTRPRRISRGPCV